MQKKMRIIVPILFLIFALFACGKSTAPQTLVDGTYTAEFKDYDSYGYKDYIIVEVKDGVVAKVQYNGINADGMLKTEDEKYQSSMEKTQDTYPKRYTADLANQLLEKGEIAKVDDIAGASWSSECFKALYNALLQKNMPAGDVSLLVVDNVPEK